MIKSGIVLGYIISNVGKEVDKVKADLIAWLPLRTCVKDIRSFLGHTSFYHRFLRYFSKIAKTLFLLHDRDMSFPFL